MKHYTLKKDVEPAKSGRTYGKPIDFAKMEVGHSFTFPQVDMKRVEAAAHAYGKQNGASFLINMSESSCTCWRNA